MPDRPAGQSERMEAAFRRAFPLKGRPSRAEIAARDDWRFYFEAGYLAAVSPVGVEGEGERAQAAWKAERNVHPTEPQTAFLRWKAGWDAALAASPSSPTGCEKCEARSADAAFSDHGRTVFGFSALCLSCMADVERSMDDWARSITPVAPSSPTGPTQQTASKVGADSERPTAVGSSPTGSEERRERPPTGAELGPQLAPLADGSVQVWGDNAIDRVPPSSPSGPTGDEIDRATTLYTQERGRLQHADESEYDDAAMREHIAFVAAALTAARGSGSDDE